jgi:hypothetical protein
MATDVFMSAALCLYSNPGFPGDRKQTFPVLASAMGQIGVCRPTQNCFCAVLRL